MNKIPLELTTNILQYMQMRDIIILSQTNKSYQNDISECNIVWEKIGRHFTPFNI